MTAYELASLHTKLFSAIQASLTVFFSVLSGFLLLSYLAAHRLRRVMAAICVVAYAGFEMLNVLGMSGLLRSYAGLTGTMRAICPPLWVVDSLSLVFLVSGMLILAASIHFFLYHRRANAKAASA